MRTLKDSRAPPVQERPDRFLPMTWAANLIFIEQLTTSACGDSISYNALFLVAVTEIAADAESSADCGDIFRCALYI